MRKSKDTPCDCSLVRSLDQVIASFHFNLSSSLYNLCRVIMSRHSFFLTLFSLAFPSFKDNPILWIPLIWCIEWNPTKPRKEMEYNRIHWNKQESNKVQWVPIESGLLFCLPVFTLLFSWPVWTLNKKYLFARPQTRELCVLIFLMQILQLIEGGRESKL